MCIYTCFMMAMGKGEVMWREEIRCFMVMRREEVVMRRFLNFPFFNYVCIFARVYLYAASGAY